MDYKSIEHLGNIRHLCSQLIKDPKDVSIIKQLQGVIEKCTTSFLKAVSPLVISSFYPALKEISQDKSSYKIAEKQAIIDTYKALLDKILLEDLNLFLNIYGFLLFEIYDPGSHLVINNPEEYKLSIVNCMSSLAKSLSTNLILELYTKQNALKLSQMLYVLKEYVNNEQMRSLKIASIDCIMAIARVANDNDFSDLEVRNKIAEIFMFFLPGLVCTLKNAALSDEKIGHKIPTIALKAWGRIVTLMMQDYNNSIEKMDKSVQFDPEANDLKVQVVSKDDIKTQTDLKTHLNDTIRSHQWYQNTDKKLQVIVCEFSKLTHHSHFKVRLELVDLSGLIIENCYKTMPISTSHLIEIVIALSEDENELVARKSRQILGDLSEKLGSNQFKASLENLEEGFYNCIMSLPRKFNGIDEKEKLVSLNLLSGYISLFGEHGLTRILHCPTHLNRLIETLIHISEIENSNVSSLEEYPVLELESVTNLGTPWKKFRHFLDEVIGNKLESICLLLAKFGASLIISDYLLDAFNNFEHRKEATFLLNALIPGLNQTNLQVIKNIIFTYTDLNNWYLPLSVMIDDLGYEHTLGDVQNNIIQVCFLVEGIGKIALALRQDFNQFLFKTLYLVFERAGSGQPLVRTAGLAALNNITKACDCSEITQLINENIDYFSFHVERKLSKSEVNEGVFNVLAVVLKYSTIDVLQTTSNMIGEILVQSCDKNKATNAIAYLRVFKMFIQCLTKWLNLKPEIPPIKTKAEKEAEVEHFRVANTERIDDFSDEIMGKSAEELYKEDMGKNQKELDDEIQPDTGEYKTPEPTLEIKITVAIITRSLNFLPSKNRVKKLLVLEILKEGLEILKDWEDDLLPLVHQIWSPLVDRFKEFDDPLIINCSFQLLMVLARLSKDFIRSRTAKDVFSNILLVLDKFSKDSYLKDKGAAYRYTQAYKLQLTILGGLARLVIDLDMLDKQFDQAMETVFPYLSEKQPIHLQREAVNFFTVLKYYDPELIEKKMGKWRESNGEFEKNLKHLWTR